MLERLFVYGTLAPGRPNAHVLSGIAGTWQAAVVRGQLLQEEWGSEQGYPGLVLREGAQTVEGFVLSSEHLQGGWSRLDAFEGPGYPRTLAQVELRGGEVVEDFVYQLAR